MYPHSGKNLSRWVGTSGDRSAREMIQYSPPGLKINFWSPKAVPGCCYRVEEGNKGVDPVNNPDWKPKMDVEGKGGILSQLDLKKLMQLFLSLEIQASHYTDMRHYWC